jgi:acyl-CoA thioester hydrolase
MARRRFLTPLRWSDMDAYGHVNNVQFLRLLEDARVLAFHGNNSDDGGDLLSTGLLVARHHIDYLRPLQYRPQPVAIDVWISEVAGASFEMCYEVLDDGCEEAGGPGGRPHSTVYARAESTMVAYDLQAGRPRRFSADERQRFAAWYSPAVHLRRRDRVRGRA